MKTYIDCITTAKGKQTFYLVAQGTRYSLFTQKYRISNRNVFGQGVSLFELSKLKKHHSTSVRNTAEKLPKHVRYIEQEYGICVLEMTKRKQTKTYIRKPIWEDAYEFVA